MNTPEEDIHTLAGEYVLGTLSPRLRRDVERRMATERPLQAAVDAWEERLLPLTELADPVTPPAHLWARLERSLDNTTRRPAAPTPTRWWDSLALWRDIAGMALAVTLVLAVTLAIRPAVTPSPSYLVVLVAPQDKAPGWVVQAANNREIQLIPLSVSEIPADKALQFWTKADGWQGPVSLGLIKPGETLNIPLDKLPPLQPNQLFELTLEPSSGSPIGKPTGPIQFIGRAVKVI